MAGLEIDENSDEFQDWYRLYYRVFTTFPTAAAFTEAQHQINVVINKYIEAWR